MGRANFLLEWLLEDSRKQCMLKETEMPELLYLTVEKKNKWLRKVVLLRKIFYIKTEHTKERVYCPHHSTRPGICW